MKDDHFPFIYKPHSRYEASVDKTRCRASVPVSGRSVSTCQCLRKPAGSHDRTKEREGEMIGLCKQHDPATKRRKDAKRKARWDLESAQRDITNTRGFIGQAVTDYTAGGDAEPLPPPIQEAVDKYEKAKARAEVLRKKYEALPK